MEPVRPIPDPPLGGPGFRLRWMRLADIDAVLAASADDPITHFTYLRKGMTRHDAVEWIQQAWRKRATADTARFAIADPTTDTMLGWIGVGFDWRHDAGEAFYALLPSARGRGVASTALDVIARWAFEVIGINRVEVLIDIDNPASRAVARRAGFVEEGVLRERLTLQRGAVDALVCSRLARDPTPDLRISSA